MLYYIAKEFLAPNSSSQDASIVCTVHKPSQVNKYSRISVDTIIRDCGNAASIGFAFQTEDDYKKSVDKLDVLINNLQTLKKQMQKVNSEFRKELTKGGIKLEGNEHDD